MPATLASWCERQLADDRPRSKSLIVTVFGDAVAPHGGEVWLGGLIALLAPFGINERLARTSLFRLVEDGWLAARRVGRRSLYGISPPGLARFARAYRRIYRAPDEHWNGNWTLVLLSRAADDPALRAALRRELGWEGFRGVAPGLFLRPAGEDGPLHELLRGLALQEAVYVMRTQAPGLLDTRPAPALVAEHWELAELAEQHARFLAAFEPLAALLQGAPAPAEALRARILLVHAWRRIMLHDPQLPASLLPSRWPGERARLLCRELYRRLAPASEQHLRATLAGPHSAFGTPAPEFTERFGGLELAVAA